MSKAEHIKQVKQDIRELLNSHNLTIQYSENLELIVTTGGDIESEDYLYFPLSDLRKR